VTGVSYRNFLIGNPAEFA